MGRTAYTGISQRTENKVEIVEGKCIFCTKSSMMDQMEKWKREIKNEHDYVDDGKGEEIWED